MHPCIESYLLRCRPFQLPAPWDCCPVDPWALESPSQPDAAFAELVAQHGERALAESGLARPDAQGQLALHPSLASADVGLVVLRDDTTGAFCDLVTEAGCVLCDRLPLFEVLADQHTIEVLSGPRRYVLLTESLVDTVLLRSMGLAAAPVVGFDTLSGRSIEWLSQYYGVKREPSQRELEEAEDAEEDPEGTESFPDPRDPLRRQFSGQEDAPADPAPPEDVPLYLVPGTGYVGAEVDDHVQLRTQRRITSRFGIITG